MAATTAIVSSIITKMNQAARRRIASDGRVMPKVLIKAEASTSSRCIGVVYERVLPNKCNAERSAASNAYLRNWLDANSLRAYTEMSLP